MLLDDDSAVQIKYSNFVAALRTQIDSVQKAFVLSKIRLDPLKRWVGNGSTLDFGE